MIWKFDTVTIEEFEWDKGNLDHISKHQVGYSECEEIFINKPFFISGDEGHSQSEERFQVLGKTNKERFIYLVFTVRKGKIRIISARDQSKKERRFYEEDKKNSKF